MVEGIAVPVKLKHILTVTHGKSFSGVAHAKPLEDNGMVLGIMVVVAMVLITEPLLNRNVESDWNAPTAKSEMNLIYCLYRINLTLFIPNFDMKYMDIPVNKKTYVLKYHSLIFK